MAVSDRTKLLKKKRNVWFIFDMAVWVITPVIMMILAFSHLRGGTNLLGIFSDNIKHVLMSFGITALIGLVCAIIIKDKIRTFLFMISTVIATALYGAGGMYVLLSIWFVDEYILHAMYKRLKVKVEINKEIDLRE